MALTPVQQLRRYVDEPDLTTYSDAELTERIEAAEGSVILVARDIWAEKMAAASGFVNVSEGGSSRSMSQAFDHAKEMWEFFAEQASATGRTVQHKLTRL